MTKTVTKKSERKRRRQNLRWDRRCLLRYCCRGVSRCRECCHSAYVSSDDQSVWYGGGAVNGGNDPLLVDSKSCEMGLVFGEYGGR